MTYSESVTPNSNIPDRADLVEYCIYDMLI